MAKQARVLPARRQREEESLLIRSAESLGRVIGTLQRQLDDASKKLSTRPAAGTVAPPADRRRSNRKPAPVVRSKGASKSGATKVRSTVDRKSKRASKSAVAKRSAGRSRSGASRKARKGTRRA